MVVKIRELTEKQLAEAESEFREIEENTLKELYDPWNSI